MKAKAKNSVRKMVNGGPIKLSPEDEMRFQQFMKTNPAVRQWHKQYVEENGEHPDIDNNPNFDFRKAFLQGNIPRPDAKGIYDWGTTGNTRRWDIIDRQEGEKQHGEERLKQEKENKKPLIDDKVDPRSLKIKGDDDDYYQFDDEDVTVGGSIRMKKGGLVGRKKKIQEMYSGGEVAVDTGEGALAGAATGATIGTAAGLGVFSLPGAVVGAIGGAVIGGGIGLTKGLIHRHQDKLAEKEQQNAIAQQQATMQAQQRQEEMAAFLASRKPFKKGGNVDESEGGKIKGKKGIDKIPMDASHKGFIVPKENAQQAMELGKKYLGWKDGKQAVKYKGNVPVKVTDGEVYFDDEDAALLRSKGINIDDLAPEAEGKSFSKKCGGKVKKMVEGGEVPPEDFITEGIFPREDLSTEKINSILSSDIKVDPDAISHPEYKTYSTDKPADLFQSAKDAGAFDMSKEGAAYDKVNPSTSKLTDPSTIALGASALASVAGTIHGISQYRQGKKALNALGNEPKIGISGSLISARQRALQESLYGFDEYTKNAALSDIASEEASALVGVTGAGSGTDYARRAQMAVNANKSRTAFYAKDATLKSQKIGQLMQMDLHLANAEDAVQRAAQESFRRKEEAAANLMLAGTSNIYGATDRLLGMGQNYAQMQFYKQMYKPTN